MKIKKSASNRAFTLIELLICLALMAIAAGAIFLGGGICKGNFWFTSDGVLRKIQITETNAVAIADYERSIYAKSVITVKTRSGDFKKFTLDSDILFNYRIEPGY